jgi:hypothetical protein
MKMQRRVSISSLFARTFFKHAANTCRVRSASAKRFQPVSLRLQMVSEDWTAVMRSLCQHSVPIGEA